MATVNVTDPYQMADATADAHPALNAPAVNGALAEAARLLESAVSPADFFPAFLDLVSRAAGATGAAVWERDPRGQFRLLQGSNLEALRMDAADNGWACHALLLEDCCLRGRGTWAAPQKVSEAGPGLVKANLSVLALLTVPVLIEKKTVALLELFFPPDLDRAVKRAVARLATDFAGFVAAFLHKHQWKQLQDQQQLWHRLSAFAVQLHRSSGPQELAHVAANDGRRLLECDQVSVGVRYGRWCRVGAVSGAVGTEQRSPLVRAMRCLFDAVCSWGDPVVYDGARDDGLSPELAQALDDYLAASKSRRLVALPLKDSRAPNPQGICGVLLAECFTDGPDAGQLLQRLELLAEHVAPAVCNAVTMDRLPLQGLCRALAFARDRLDRKGLLHLAAAAVVVAAVVGVLAFLQLPLRAEATGQLVPQQRRIVYAAVNGRVVQLAAQHGDRVAQGQELLLIQDSDGQLKMDQLSVKISSLSQKLAFLDEQLGKNLSPKDRAAHLGQRIETVYELNKAKVERNLLVAELRNPRQSPVLAPLSGQVITFDVREKLVGKTVKPGDPLLRVADVGGPWEVELLIPERQVGMIRDALARSEDGELEVELLLASDPHRTYRGKLCREDLAGETRVQHDKVVLPARARLADRGLLTQLERMPVGVEVRARIHCGGAPAGYVWFGEVWDFVYERFLF